MKPESANQFPTKKILPLCLGFFWLLDGILQFQPAMFTKTFISGVIAPNLQNQPAVIAGIINFGITVFSCNTFWANLFSALIQIIIGALLLFPFREKIKRFALWLSVVWGLVVWVFGEGFGNIFTGMATFYTGAPGSALLYVVLALFLLDAMNEKNDKPLYKLPAAAGAIFIVTALLNLAPMFWKSGMLSMLTMAPMGSGQLGAIESSGTVIGNFIAIDILVILGIFLVFLSNRSVAWTTILFLLVVWIFSQGFGGLQTFPFGTTTDPNSAPLFLLFLLPLFFTKTKQPTSLQTASPK